MIDIASRTNQTIAVLGLGVSGIAAARALAASGADVSAWDDSADRRNEAADIGIPTRDLTKAEFSDTDALILAPGIPFTHKPHPIVSRAQEAGCPIIGDIELLIENCPNTRAIGITGTNGKSTTTALIGHVFDHAGRPCQIGGNLGPPVLEFSPPVAEEVLVLELSSYQLDLTDRAEFSIAVFINVSPDHLDRHGSMESYVAAKKRIFRNDSRPSDQRVAIIGIDDSWGQDVFAEISADPHWTAIPVSVTSEPENGIWVKDGILTDATSGPPIEVADLNGINTLRGCHNWQNAACAYAGARVSGIEADTIAEALPSYPGLPHRMEFVSTIGNIAYVNDSKATNVEAAITALKSFDNIYWIAGGQAKDEPLAPLAEYANRIQHTFLIGEAENRFADALSPEFAVTRCGDLITALRMAHDRAQADGSEGTVLLSPACASFDQWQNFGARGDAFRDAVHALMRESSE